MKLNDITYGPVQSFGRHDIAGIGAVARANAAAAGAHAGAAGAEAAAANAWGNVARRIGSTAVQISQDWQDREDRESLERATYEITKAEAEWRSAHSDKRYYSSTEVQGLQGVRLTDQIAQPDGTVIEIAREDIPAHEVQPSLYRNHMDSAIQAQALTIQTEDVRDRWTLKMSGMAVTNWARREEAAAGQQQQAIRFEQNFRIQESTRNGQYDIARELANNYSGSVAERDKIRLGIDIQEEKDSYTYAVSSGSEEVIEHSIDRLITNSANSYLSPVEQTSVLNSLNVAASQIEAGKKEALRVSEDEWAKDGDTLIAEGGLTHEWLYANRHNLSQTDFRHFANYVDRQSNGGGTTKTWETPEAKIVYMDLWDDAMAGELDVPTRARAAFLGGQVTKSAYDQILARQTEALDEDTTSPYLSTYKRGEKYLSVALKPNDLNPKAGAHQRQAAAMEEWRNWAESPEGQGADQATAQLKYEQIGKDYNYLNTEEFLFTWPKPTYLVGGRGDLRNVEVIDATEANTMAAFMAKHEDNLQAVVNDPEFIRQVNLLQAYRKNIEKSLMLERGEE